jgi:hypothetical protein
MYILITVPADPKTAQDAVDAVPTIIAALSAVASSEDV